MLRAGHAVFDRLVYGKLRAALGGDGQAVDQGGDEVAAGWGGDRYETFRTSTGLAGVWMTTWDSDKDAVEFEKLLKAWKHGDLGTLQAMLFSEAEKYPDLMNLFLTARNLAWVDPLDQMLKNGEKVMVLVGTGHFTSDTGLIELLRKRGHRVRHYSEVTDF